MSGRMIKFRAWNWKDEKYEHQPLIFNTKGSKFDWQYKASKSGKGMQPVLGDLEQFTGLHDKNGKEIYEGDIVQIEECNHKKVVEWSFEPCCFVLRHLPSQPYSENFFMDEFKGVVIGNINENPELLGETK